jgi:hypothetical protein
MSDKCIIQFTDGTSTYYVVSSKSRTEFEEGRHMMQIYDTTGRRELVAAHHTDEISAIRWET